MTQTSLNAGIGQKPLSVDTIQSSYMIQVHRRRLYSGLALAIFVLLMVSGFNVADDRNAGGFWDGLHQIGDYPAEVLAEAWEKRAELPSLITKYFPALIETINIAAVSTLIGTIVGLFLALLGTRGLALWPRLIPLFRRISDIMRAVPEIVIALVLIFVLGGGPVPAMIAIAIHTAGALGKLFSEVAENADLKSVEGLASTGARWSQRMMLGVLPQVAPNFVSYTLLRFEVTSAPPPFWVSLAQAGLAMNCATRWLGDQDGSMKPPRSSSCFSAPSCFSTKCRATTAIVSPKDKANDRR